MKRIRVAIVDDQTLVRTGFRLVLEEDDDFTVVGEAGGGRAGIALAARTRPDIVLMDIRMPDLDGIAATRQIVRDGASRVIVLTTFDSDAAISRAVNAGASGFLLKDARPSDLMDAIRTVHSGDTAMPERIVQEAASLPAPQGEPIPTLDALSSRELEVFIAIGQGLTNAEIAAQFFLTESTVKTHVGQVLAKLAVRDRIQAVILAHRSGVLD